MRHPGPQKNLRGYPSNIGPSSTNWIFGSRFSFNHPKECGPCWPAQKWFLHPALQYEPFPIQNCWQAAKGTRRSMPKMFWFCHHISWDLVTKRCSQCNSWRVLSNKWHATNLIWIITFFQEIDGNWRMKRFRLADLQKKCLFFNECQVKKQHKDHSLSFPAPSTWTTHPLVKRRCGTQDCWVNSNAALNFEMFFSF